VKEIKGKSKSVNIEREERKRTEVQRRERKLIIKNS
jgi:hypothetical protein